MSQSIPKHLHDEFDKRYQSDTRGNLLTVDNADMFRLTSIESIYDQIHSEVTRLQKSVSRTSSSRRDGVRLVSYDSEDESSLLETDSESEDEPSSWNHPEPAMVQRTHESLGYSDSESTDDSASEFEHFDLPDSISSRPSKIDHSDLAQFYTPPPIKKNKTRVQRDPNPYGLTCPNAHNLKFDSGYMKVCSSCKKTMSSGYCCKCDFAICEDCYEMVHELTATLKSDKAPSPTKTHSTRKPPKEQTLDTPGKKKRVQVKKRKRKTDRREPEPVPQFQKGRKGRKTRANRRKKNVKHVHIASDAVKTSLDQSYEISVDAVHTPSQLKHPSREPSPQPPSGHYVKKTTGRSYERNTLSMSDSGSYPGSDALSTRYIQGSYSRPNSNHPLSHTLVNKRPSANSQALFQDLQEQLTQLTSQMNLLASTSFQGPEDDSLSMSLDSPDLPPVMQARHSKSRSRRSQSYRIHQSTKMQDPRTLAPVESPPPSNLQPYATRAPSFPNNFQPVDGIWEWIGSEGLDRYLAHIGHGWWSRTYISLFGQERLQLKMTPNTCECTRGRGRVSQTSIFQLGEPQNFCNLLGEQVVLSSGSTYEDGILCMTFRSKHGEHCTKRYVDESGDLVWETYFTGKDQAQTKLKFTLRYSTVLL